MVLSCVVEQIDNCGKWCLFRCGTNITAEQYHETSNEEMTLSLICNDQTLSDALPPVAESTRLSSYFHSVSKFIRHVMCLPVLPAEALIRMFTNIIAIDVPITPMPTLLRELLNYI